ncbi:MAG: MotA/TolQ/ExbB proton channel family protein [Neisseriaceae bacterium]|nr:MotA/TolQ/ExbB proton channel family protein [Neisseriaceae bacterium]
MWQIIEEAGWPIWLNIVASIVALAIVFERLWVLRYTATVPSSRFTVWATALQNKPFVLPENPQKTVLDRIIHAGVTCADRQKETIQDAMTNQARIESVRMERFLNTLGTIAAMAPLMGLLGTVVGMIEIFASQSPTNSDPAQLAHGISVALYNTAFGLIVAIPAMIFYRHFRHKVNRALADAETAANRLWHMMIRRSV